MVQVHQHGLIYHLVVATNSSTAAGGKGYRAVAW